MARDARCASCARRGSELCLGCVGGSRYRRVREMKRLVVRSKRAGSSFEREVRDRYVAAAARLRADSGATWSRPGDVALLGRALIEAKDRGVVTARGAKTFTIHKDHLDKIGEEADGLLPVLAFRFKDDDAVYAIVPYDGLCELVARLRDVSYGGMDDDRDG